MLDISEHIMWSKHTRQCICTPYTCMHFPVYQQHWLKSERSSHLLNQWPCPTCLSSQYDPSTMASMQACYILVSMGQ